MTKEVKNLELHVSDTDVSGGSIAISWCLSKKLIEELADYLNNDPQLVVVVAPDGDHYHVSKEHRSVVPLKDLVTYVPFKTPGKNKIWAFVSYKEKLDAKNRYLSKSYGEYGTHILNSNGSDYSSYLGEAIYKNRFSEPLSVDIPKECFAPEPSEWEKSWVNWLFSARPTDQCHFRRRRLFAYTVQPIVFLFNYLLRLGFFLASTLIGARNWTPQYLFHPLSTDTDDLPNTVKGGTYFVRRAPYPDGDVSLKNDLKYFAKKYWSLPFMPIIVLLSMLSWYVPVLGAAFLILGGVVLLMLLIMLLASGALNSIFVAWVERLSELSFTKVNKHWYEDQNEIDLLVCNGQKKPTKVSELPAHKRTLMLRFKDLKSKVCRPYSA